MTYFPPLETQTRSHGMSHCHGFACLVRLGTDSQTYLVNMAWDVFRRLIGQVQRTRAHLPPPPTIRYESDCSCSGPTPSPTVSPIPTSAPSEDCKGMAGFYLLSTACEVSLVAPYSCLCSLPPLRTTSKSSAAMPGRLVVKSVGRRVGFELYAVRKGHVVKCCCRNLKGCMHYLRRWCVA